MAEIKNIEEFRQEVKWLVNGIKYSDEGQESENINASLFISFIDISGLESKEGFDTPGAKKALEVLSPYKLPLADMLSHTKYMFIKDNCMAILDEMALLGSKENNDIIQPRELTQLMLSLADIKETDEVYNPFAGIGSFALALPDHNIVAEEIDEVCWAMSTLYLIAKGAKTTPVCRDSLNFKELNGKTFDKIIFHPAFFENGQEAKAVFVLVEKTLKENGRLVCVLPSYFMYADDGTYSTIRGLLADPKYRIKVYALPSNLFTPSTSVSSCILVVDKIQSQSLTVIDARTFYQDGSYSKNILDLKAFTDTKPFEYNINLEDYDYSNIEPSMLEAQKQFQDVPIVRFDEIAYVYGEEDAKDNEYDEESDSYEHDCIWPLGSRDASDDPFNCDIELSGNDGDEAERFFEELGGEFLGICTCPDKIKIADIKIDWVQNIAYDNRDSFIAELRDNDNIDRDYIKCILTSDFVFLQLKPLLVKNKRTFEFGEDKRTFTHVDISDIKGLKIPLPELDEQRKYVINEMRRRIEANKIEQKKAFDNYEKEIHCRKHALSQTVSGLNSLWQTLTAYMDRNEGKTDVSDCIGLKNKMLVSEIWNRIGTDINMICQQVEHLADENQNWGENEEIDIRSFVSDYIKSHESNKFKFSKTVVNEDRYNPLKPFIIPEKALTQVFDNIVSNAIQHGFSDENRDDYEVLFVISAEDGGSCIRILNNGAPLSDGIDEESMFQYGYSTALNESSSEGDNHIHSGIGLYDVKNILGRYGADVSMHRIAEGEKYTVETIIKY